MIRRVIHKLILMSFIFVPALVCKGECAELIHSIRVNSEKVNDFCFTGIAKFSPDGKYIASGGTGPILSIIDVKTGKIIKTITVGGSFTVTTGTETGRLTSAVEKYTSPIGALAFTSDSKYIAAGGSSRYIHLYNVETGELVKTYDITQRTVESIAFSNDDKSIIASSLYSLCVFSADTKTKVIEIDSPVLVPVVISAKGNYIASGNTIYKQKDEGSTISEVDKRVVYLWEYPSLKLIREIDGDGRLLAISADEKYLAYASGDFSNDIQIWDLQNNKPLSLFKDKANDETMTSVIFTPDGKYLLCAEGKKIKIIDLAANKIKESWTAHNEGITSLHISPGGEYLSTTGEDGFLKIWRLTNL